MAQSSSVSKSAGNSRNTEIRPYQTLAERLYQLAENDSDWQVELMRDTVDKIAIAESPEDVFAATEMGSNSLRDATELLNKPVAVDFDSFRWIKSAEQYSKNSLGVFLVFKGILDSGEETTVTVGAPNVTATLGRLQQMFMDKDLANGYRVMFKTKQTSNNYNMLLVTKAV